MLRGVFFVESLLGLAHSLVLDFLESSLVFEELRQRNSSLLKFSAAVTLQINLSSQVLKLNIDLAANVALGVKSSSDAAGNCRSGSTSVAENGAVISKGLLGR